MREDYFGTRANESALSKAIIYLSALETRELLFRDGHNIITRCLAISRESIVSRPDQDSYNTSAKILKGQAANRRGDFVKLELLLN